MQSRFSLVLTLPLAHAAATTFCHLSPCHPNVIAQQLNVALSLLIAPSSMRSPSVLLCLRHCDGVYEHHLNS